MCLEKHLHEACVYIYSAMGLYEECVSLALEVRMQLLLYSNHECLIVWGCDSGKENGDW